MIITDEKRIIKKLHSDWIYYEVLTNNDTPMVSRGVDFDIVYCAKPTITNDEFYQLEFLINQFESKIHESTVNNPVHLYTNDHTNNEVARTVSYYYSPNHYKPCIKITITDPIRWMSEMVHLNNIPLPNLLSLPDLPGADDTLNFIQKGDDAFDEMV